MMTRKIQVHQVDAFTRERFTGNPAGVVLNADGKERAHRDFINEDRPTLRAGDLDGDGLGRALSIVVEIAPILIVV